MIAQSKSPNKRFRMFVKALPLGEETTKDLETRDTSQHDEDEVRGRLLTREHGWDVDDARRIWCFGPDTRGPNVMVDVTKHVQYINEIRHSCVSAFQWVTREGVCAEEPMRGVRMNILDAVVCSYNCSS